MRIRMALLPLVVFSLLTFPSLAQEPDKPAKPDKPSLKVLKRDLLRAINSEDSKKLEEAIFQYRFRGDRFAVMALVQFVKKNVNLPHTIYWQLINGIAAFDTDESLEELGDTILKHKEGFFARDLMFGLRNNRSTRVIPLHAMILAKGTSDLQQMSIDQLTDIWVVESVDAIIHAMREETVKSSMMWWADRALQILTGANLGEDGDRWYDWWQYQREKGLPKVEEGDNTGMVTDNLDPIRKYEFKILKKMPMGQVIVINTQCPRGSCDFDAIEDILQRMEIPHTVVKREDFEKSSTELGGVMAIVVNCTQTNPHCICPTCVPGGTKQNRLYKCTQCNKHETISHGLTARGVKKIKKFVEAGGNLFTEDWGVKEILEKAWPRYVVGGSYLREQEVDIAPARGRTSHPLMRGVFMNPADAVEEPEEVDGDGEDSEIDEDEKKTKDGKKTIDEEDEEEIIRRIRTLKHQWKIDDESPYLNVRNKREVVKLLESEKVGKLAGGKNDAVAISFFARKRSHGSAGKGAGVERRPSGRILHVLSHFGKQSSIESEYALQNLLLNFLLEANREWNLRKKK